MFIEIARAGVITDAPKISEVLIKTFDFLLSIFGMLAIIGLVLAGIIYLTASGNEKRIEVAKRAFLYSIVGIAVVLGAMVIVKTIGNFIG